MPALLHSDFTPRFWDEADQRLTAVREIKRRYELLRDELGDPSYQKDLLAQRAIFVSIQLETLEAEAIQGKEIPIGSYVQMVNCLQGLLAKLGLERQVRVAGGLKAYAEDRVL